MPASTVTAFEPTVALAGGVGNFSTAANHACAVQGDGGSPSELLASIALRKAPVLRERTKTIVRRNLDEVEALLSRFPTQLGWTRPNAGTTGFLHIKKEPAEGWALRVLQETGVLFAPSVLFGFADTHVRVGLGRSNLSECLTALGPWLERQQ